MKIIRHGNPKRSKPDIEFECRCCGCIFIAEYGEYQKFRKMGLGQKLFVLNVIKKLIKTFDKRGDKYCNTLLHMLEQKI